MDYTQARKFIDTLRGRGGPMGLEAVTELLHLLHDPQDKVRVIHIAGTNGKGSVLAYLESVLEKSGYRVGRYISPTLFSYRERIQVNGTWISREAFALLISEIAEAAEQMRERGLQLPSVFEAETAAAFLYFYREDCDFVLLETGMGGRLDATNVVRAPLLTVMASISMDHQKELGSTLAEIAWNKAGIFREGVPVVSAAQPEEAEAVIRAEAEKKHCPCTFVRREELRILSRSVEEQSFSYPGFGTMRISLAGKHQTENAALALECVGVLRTLGVSIPEAAVRDALALARWKGRFTVLQKNPYVVLDGAHNADAAARLREAVNDYFPMQRKFYIMGVFSDKEYDKIIDETAGLAEHIVTIEIPDNPRALSAAELAEAVRRVNPSVEAAGSISAAVKRCFELASENDVIVIFGSLSFLSEAERAVEEVHKKEEHRMKDLQELRQEIDSVDIQITELFERRMQISGEVARYKIANGRKVFDKEREKSKLETLMKMADNEFDRHGIQELFSQIMSMSRKLQYQLLEENGASGRLPFIAVDDIDRKNIRVAYQGVEGAYSYAAMQEYFGKDVNCFHVKKWRDAMEAISEGSADYAVLPIENSSAGIVADNYDLLVDFENYIVGEQIIRCEHALVGLPGTKLSQIRKVYSHQQALSQCEEYLDRHPEWQLIPFDNTAMAAKKVAEDGDPTQAAVASHFAAEHFGLEILADQIYYNEANSTRFLVITNQRIFRRDASKISICFEVPHSSGSLYNILSHFIYNNLNMNKIESRPITGRNWEYRFFIDFDGNLGDSAVKNALRGIREEATNMKILGNY